MKRVLLTGMSGTGKSSVINRLGSLGFTAVDTDYDGFSYEIDVGDGPEQLWREDRIQHLLSSEDADALVISGCTRNQVRFYPQFDHIILLTAPAALLVERLATRTTNPYGKHPAELARVLVQQRTIEPLLRGPASLEVDTSRPLDDVVGVILEHVQL